MTTATFSTSSLLDKLRIKDVNSGASYGVDGWIDDPAGKPLVSLNPSTGEPIARVVQATPEAYERVMAKAVEAFGSWRMVPAPQRGRVVGDLGEAVRGL